MKRARVEAFEENFEEIKVKMIDASNFFQIHLEQILNNCKIKIVKIKYNIIQFITMKKQLIILNKIEL